MNTPSVIPPANFASEFRTFLKAARVPTILTSVRGDAVKYALSKKDARLEPLGPLVARRRVPISIQQLYGPEVTDRSLEESDLYIEWSRLQQMANDVAGDVEKFSRSKSGDQWLSLQASDAHLVAQNKGSASTMSDRIQLSSHYFVSGLYYAALDSTKDRLESEVMLTLSAETLREAEGLAMASAMVAEVALEVALAIGDEDGTARLSEFTATALHESIEDYFDLPSLGIRIARGLYHSYASGADDLAMEFLQASSDYNDVNSEPDVASFDLLRLVDIMLRAEKVEWDPVSKHLWSAEKLIRGLDGYGHMVPMIVKFAKSAGLIASTP